MADLNTDYSQVYDFDSTLASAINEQTAKLEERAYNELSTKKGRQWAEEMWNKQNEYNLPANQVQRLKDAGINPNIAFGSSASTVAGPVGSVPHSPQTSNEGRLNRRIERASVLASIRQMNENTRRERNNNDLFEYLLDDRKKHDALKMASDVIEYDWNLNHKAAALDEDLYAKVLGNRLTLTRDRILDLQGQLYQAQINHEWRKVEQLRRQIAHEQAKFGFEDEFYRRGLNPYETSTVAGFLRTAGAFPNWMPKMALDIDRAAKNHWSTWKTYWKLRKEGKIDRKGGVK